MAYRLNEASLTAAVRHLGRYGDTDVFPHLPEIVFLTEQEAAVVDELTQIDLDSYAPSGAVEALAPKSRYGFRIAHQLPLLDTLLLLSCVLEIGEKIEEKRLPVADAQAFSYRFSIDSTTGQIFRNDRTYKDWLHKQQEIISANRRINTIVSTDISDYYSRINFHRLENLLDEVAPGHGASRFIKKHIAVIRAKQSFGLPVGGSTARLLAELALSDIDDALISKGIAATRFVDDYRILLRRSESPYDALGYLAEQLGINEGLSLNVAKTSVVSRRDYLKKLEHLTSDLDDEVEGVALDSITADIYFDGDVDEEDLKKLKGLNLVGMLKEEIGAENWDISRIKVLFRALKIVKPEEAIDFINDEIEAIVIFAKELCLLMESLEEDADGCFDGLIDKLLQSILSPPASSVQVIRTWLLEILVRGIINIPITRLKDIENLANTIDKRQLLFIRGRVGDKAYFRSQKTALQKFSEFERTSLVWGASCLPKDEYEKWLDSLKVDFRKPLGHLYLKWLKENKIKLNSKLKSNVLDMPD